MRVITGSARGRRLKALEGQDVSSVGDSTPMAVVDASNVAQMDDWK